MKTFFQRCQVAGLGNPRVSRGKWRCEVDYTPTSSATKGVSQIGTTTWDTFVLVCHASIKDILLIVPQIDQLQTLATNHSSNRSLSLHTPTDVSFFISALFRLSVNPLQWKETSFSCVLMSSKLSWRHFLRSERWQTEACLSLLETKLRC